MRHEAKGPQINFEAAVADSKILKDWRSELNKSFEVDLKTTASIARKSVMNWDRDRLLGAIFFDHYSVAGQELGQNLLRVIESGGEASLEKVKDLWDRLYSHYGEIEKELGGKDQLTRWSESGKWRNKKLLENIENADRAKLRQLIIERAGLGMLVKLMLATSIEKNDQDTREEPAGKDELVEWRDEKWEVEKKRGVAMGKCWYEADGNSSALVHHLIRFESNDEDGVKSDLDGIVYFLFFKPQLNIEKKAEKANPLQQIQSAE